MFTKKSVISAQNKLRGSDAKNLKKAAAVALPYLPEADLDAVFPSKCARLACYSRSDFTLALYTATPVPNALASVQSCRADVFVAKVNHRALVYFVGSEKANPLFFDPVRLRAARSLVRQLS